MIDVNKPVTNPALLTAFETMQSIPGAENEAAFVEQLKAANFLMPLDGELTHDAPDADGKVTLTEGGTLRFPMLADREGRPLHIAFTDWDALRLWKDQPDQQTLVVPFSDLPAMVLREDSQCAGVIANPGSHSIFLARETLARLSGRPAPYVVKAQTRVMIGEPADYPHELAAALKRHLKTMREVKRAWLLLMQKENEQSFLIIVDFVGDRAKISNEIGAAAIPHLKQGQLVDIVPANDSFGQNAIRDHKPFYKKGPF